MKNQTLVIGGTGTIGTSVIELLKENNVDFKVMVRNEEKSEELKAKGLSTVIGTLGGEQSLSDVLVDVHTIFLLTSSSPSLFDQHKSLIDHAVEAGVRKIVRLSALPAETNPHVPMYSLHRKADDYLVASGLEYVILRPSYFLQNFLFSAPYIKGNNMFAAYFGNTKVPMVDTRDIAQAAYVGLTSNDVNNTIQTITGEKSISFTDVAEVMSKQLGKTVNYVPLSYEDQKAGFIAAGVDEWTVDSSLQLIKEWGEVAEHLPSHDFEKMTGATPKSIEEFVSDFTPYFQ